LSYLPPIPVFVGMTMGPVGIVLNQFNICRWDCRVRYRYGIIE
jgi:hypothetical protein